MCINDTMTILIQILIILAVAVIVMWLTSAYWLRIIRKLKTLAHNKTEPQSLDLMKERAASQKQAKTLNSRVEFVCDVLSEVQQQLKDQSGPLKEMVEDTVELIRYENMSDIEKADVVQVNSFCHEVFNSCKSNLDGTVDLRLVTELEDDETICTSKRGLNLVLEKLLICSMQYTHEGEIALEVKRHRKKQVDYIKFAVSDTGLGVPENAKEAIFERMPDADLSYKVVVARLRLCRAIVKLLGGSIFIDPSREKGTSIVFTIKTSVIS